MKKGIILFAAVSGAVLLALSAVQKPGEAQTKSPDKSQETKLRYEVVVTLKLIQVFVTDDQGNPVTDLEAADFELLDNGRPQKITDFEKHSLLLPGKAGEVVTPVTVPPPAPRKLNRKFFFLFDLDRTDLPGLAQAKKAALHFLDTQLLSTDEVGVLSYSGDRGLILSQYLSSDHEQTRQTIKAFRELAEKPSMGVMAREITLGSELAAAEAEADSRSERPSAPASDAQPSYARPTGTGANPEAESAADKTAKFPVVMKELARALGAIEGQKNIIFFSRGFARSLYTGDLVMQKGLDDVGKEMATAGSPLYAVNTEGRRQQMRPASARGDMVLQKLSALSGGKYFEDVSDSEKISREIQQFTGNYYVLGYSIDQQWDGLYHEIQVRVKREGCLPYTQSGYYNPKPFAKRSKFEKQIHLIDLAMSPSPHYELPQRFPLAALPFSELETANLVILARTSGEQIKNVVAEETEMAVLVFNERNELLHLSQRELALDALPPEEFISYTIVGVPPGRYECRLVFRCLQTGRAALGAAAAVIKKPDLAGKEEARIFPPLLLIPDKAPRFVRLAREDAQSEQHDILNLKRIYPLIPHNHAPLVGDLEPGTRKMLAVVRMLTTEQTGADIRLGITLSKATGEGQVASLPFTILRAEAGEGTDILLVEIELPELGEGRYNLEFSAEDESGRPLAKTARELLVSPPRPRT